MSSNKKGVKKCFATGKVINENAKHVILVTKQGNRVLEETYFSIEGWKTYISDLVNKKYDELEDKALKHAEGLANQFLSSVFKKDGGKKRKPQANKKRK